MRSNPVKLLGIVAAMALPAFADPILIIEPASVPVGIGQTFSVDISILGAVDLYAFQFDLGFDPTILSAQSISEGAFLGTGGDTFFIPGAIDNAGGTASFTANTLLTAISGVSGDGVLASISFLALQEGSSPINLFGVTLLDSSLSGVESTTRGGSVSVSASATPIPEPSAFVLLGTALLFVWRHRPTQSHGSAPSNGSTACRARILSRQL